jgi:hypothetical protein
MGVSKSDDLGVREGLSETLRRWRPILISMCDHHHESVELELDHLGKAGPQLEAICIAVDSCHGSDSLQLMEEIKGPDISTVDNAVDPSEYRAHRGSQSAVGI